MGRSARVLLAVAVLLAVVGGGGVAAQGDEESQARLTVHSRVCPAGYAGEDIYGDCHENVGSAHVEFRTAGPDERFAAATRFDGDVSFGELEPGRYTVSSDMPDGVVRATVMCSVDGQPEQNVAAARTGENAVAIELAAGSAVICDWYHVPAVDAPARTAQLEIHSRLCPVNYAGDTPYQDCHDTIGFAIVGFTLYGPTQQYDSTAGAGNVSFAWLPTGWYTISADISTRFTRADVYCSQRESPGENVLHVAGEATAYEMQQVSIGLDPGDDLICDWYTVPSVDVGRGGYELPVMVYVCERDPGGVGIAMGRTPEGCVGAAGVRVSLTLVDDGRDLGSCVTNERGGCRIKAPFNRMVRAEEDVRTLPTGYAPRLNPVELPVYTEYAAAIFVNLPG